MTLGIQRSAASYVGEASDELLDAKRPAKKPEEALASYVGEAIRSTWPQIMASASQLSLCSPRP
eukprot:4894194-Amphidinium_carterae.1